MSLYAISDLHLSFSNPKPMDKFGAVWSGHPAKIEKNWKDIVKAEDTVIINGDISWAMRLEDALADLDFIAGLPGRKIVHEGNHDYWWPSTNLLNSMYKDNIFFMKNDFAAYGGTAICGGRGWICPNDGLFSAGDMKIYKRELIRIKASLGKAVKSGFSSFILSLHFPPFNDTKGPSGFIDIIKEYNIKNVIYGHIHGSDPFNAADLGETDGVRYTLVSADYLNFVPFKLL